MSKKLSKQELEAKMKFHKKKASYYKKKIEASKNETNRIGFKWYN